MTQQQSGQLVIASDLAEVKTVQNEIIPQVENAGFSSEAVFAIRLALDEAVSNAIRHGNALDADKTVSVDYHVEPRLVRIRVCDQGPGFSPDTLPDPTNPENLCEPHGRGVMLIRAYMTEVSFSDTGNCVTMVKTAACRKPYED